MKVSEGQVMGPSFWYSGYDDDMIKSEVIGKEGQIPRFEESKTFLAA